MRIITLLFLVACGSKSPAPAPPGPGTGSAPAAECPPAKESTDMCAAVVTYAKTAAGTCCEYSSPCTVPIEGQQYSDAACTTAMGPAQP